jgi:hypothetical protein
MSIYVRMDVLRKRSQIAIVDDAGEEQRNRNVSNDPTQLVPILGELPPGTQSRSRPPTAGGWPVELLEELELEPHLVHPSRCRAIAAARLENDRVDARTLAQLLRADLLTEAWIAPKPPGICGVAAPSGQPGAPVDDGQESHPRGPGRPRDPAADRAVDRHGPDLAGRAGAAADPAGDCRGLPCPPGRSRQTDRPAGTPDRHPRQTRPTDPGGDSPARHRPADRYDPGSSRSATSVASPPPASCAPGPG